MIPRTIYSADHEQFRDSVRQFLAIEAIPYHAQWEKDGQTDRERWNKAGMQGFLAPTVPEELGDDEYILNGFKTFITNGQLADLVIVVGMKAQDTSELFFQDVRIPKENLLRLLCNTPLLTYKSAKPLVSLLPPFKTLNLHSQNWTL